MIIEGLETKNLHEPNETLGSKLEWINHEIWGGFRFLFKILINFFNEVRSRLPEIFFLQFGSDTKLF